VGLLGSGSAADGQGRGKRRSRWSAAELSEHPARRGADRWAGRAHERVVAVARAAAPAELETIELFDVYQGKNLGEGRKSMAYAFTYRSKTGTLTDEQANGFQAKVNAALKAQLPAEIREG
jgi:hypothetical protein